MNNIKYYSDFLNENEWADLSVWEKAKEDAEEVGKKLTKTVKNLIGSKSNYDPNDLIGKDLIEENNPDCADEFKEKVIDICDRLGIDNPNWLMLTIIKESDCNPKARNPKGSASGLIQFLDSTAHSLGTSIGAIRQMNGVEQLEYVYKYYKPYANQMTCPEDVYLVTFMPGYFKDRNNGSKVIATGSAVAANKIMDLNQDGQIRMDEFKEYVTNNISKKYKDGIA